MEDISTKEAIQAEERETELRKRIRELEERSSAVSNTVEQSESYYQVRITNYQKILKNAKFCIPIASFKR